MTDAVGVSAPVLGTPIARLEAWDGPVFLISDLHVPEGGGQPFANLALALAEAHRQEARLFILGDLFDSYVTRAQVKVGIWRQVCAALAEMAAAGVAIDVLVGNRDFLLGPEFAAASGARLHRGGLRLRLCGAETLLLHGDELCQNDLPYQRAKRWLRSGAVRLLARHLPVRMALRAAARARRKSTRVIASGDQTRFLPTAEALELALGDGAERVVFGHIHRRGQTRVGAGTAWSLPAFDEDPIGYRVDAAGVAAVRFCEDGTAAVETA